MAEQTPQQAVEGQAGTPSQEASPPPPTRTPEQVEAEWSAKQSALGRQHAATEAELRSQIDALKAEGKTSGERTAAEQDAIKTENEQLRKQIADRDQKYSVDLRSTKYPEATKSLPPEVLATMDEAKLAGLEARLTTEAAAPPPPPVDPSMPAKQPDVPKPMSEKSSDELMSDLKRMAPEFAASLEKR